MTHILQTDPSIYGAFTIELGVQKRSGDPLTGIKQIGIYTKTKQPKRRMQQKIDILLIKSIL